MGPCRMSMQKERNPKYLRKDCYHRIKCMLATFLTAFIWRRPLNSTVLTIATHRKLKKVSYGTSTQVIAQMINKQRIKMIHEELYNVRDLSQTRGLDKLQKEYCSNIIYTCTQFQLIYINVNLLGLEIYSYWCLLFYSNYLLNLYQPLSNSLGPSSSTHYLQIYCLGLIRSTYLIFWVWAANRDLTLTNTILS